MQTITEMQAEARALQKKLADLKALCIQDKREPTDEEVTFVEEALERLKQLRKLIKMQHRMDTEADALEQSTEKPDDVVDGAPDPADEKATRTGPRFEVGLPNASKDKFRSLGEQIAAVIVAGSPGGRTDPRLLQHRATGLGELVPSEGGFLVQTDFQSAILQRVYEVGVVASRCRKFTIGANANSLKINAIDESTRVTGSRWGGVQGYWLHEAGTKTASQPKFRQIELKLKKLIGMCYLTDELLEDARAVESIVSQAFAEEIAFLLDDAIVNGTGAGQPLGIMNSAALVSIVRAGAGAIVHADVLGMWARLWARSRPGAVWFINQDCEPQLHAMYMAMGTAVGAAVYLPPGGVSGAPYATLFGRPVIAIEQCQTMGTTGDVILADMGEYLLIDKGGVDSAMSIHVRFIYDESAIRFVYRCDGAPAWNITLTPFKGSNTQSPFVCMDAGS